MNDCDAPRFLYLLLGSFYFIPLVSRLNQINHVCPFYSEIFVVSFSASPGVISHSPSLISLKLFICLFVCLLVTPALLNGLVSVLNVLLPRQRFLFVI